MGIARDIARLKPNSSGELPTANLQNSAITTAKIADSAVVEVDIANNAVTATKINDSYWKLIADVNFTGDTSISGLNGDADEIYMFNVHLHNNASGDAIFGFQFNDDTATTNYGAWIYRFLERHDNGSVNNIVDSNNRQSLNYARVGRTGFGVDVGVQFNGFIKCKRYNVSNFASNNMITVDYKGSQFSTTDFSAFLGTIHGVSGYYAQANLTSLRWIMGSYGTIDGNIKLWKPSK